MAATETYDPKSVTAIFGALVVNGFVDGTMLSVEKNEPDFSQVVGTDGLVAHVRSRNGTGKVTLTLMQTSAANLALLAIRNRDLLFGDGQGAFQLTDLSGRTVINSPNARIEGPPKTVSFGKEIEGREWVILLDQVNYVAL